MTDRIRIYTRPAVADYDVIIEAGSLDRLGEHVRQSAPAHRYVIISDSTVAHIYGERVRGSLEQAGASATLIEFPAGESSKNVDTWQSLSERMLHAGLGRDACVIALGGGVTGDLAGFAAATFMRGIPLVQVPTTLLAMIDASIGGKTGVDTTAGKNLLGAFHQPRFVLIDPHTLRTLPAAQLRSGLAEAVKHGAIADAQYAQWLAASALSIFEHKTHTLVSLIARSVEIKAHFVSEDVHEQGARAALNFGHTIAHALEHVSGYALSHGDAVAIGMLVEAAAGEAAGVTEPGTSDQLRHIARTLGLPASVPAGMDTAAIVAATRTDKKTRAREQRYTLITRMGEAARTAQGEWTCPLSDDVVSKALTRLSTAGPDPASV